MTHADFFKKLEQDVQNALEQWQCPSLALGVICDGEILYCGGIGLRDRENALPADGATVYQIGSSSKSFTALLCAKLVDEGKLAWDEPIRTYAPEVRFQDPFVTANVTIRDLLSHRTGLPRHEYAWYLTSFTREELVHNIRYFEPETPFRTHMHYNNFGYILLGYLIEKVTGRSWEDCVQKEIFEPLGMGRSSVYLTDIEKDPNHAEPYGVIGKSLSGEEHTDFYRTNVENKEKGIGAPFGPAGSINSCVEDMLRYLRFQLGDGTPLLTSASLGEMHKPNIFLPAPLDMPMEETVLHSYCMGWIAEMYRGHKVLQHGGNVNGFSAQMFLVPDQKLGIVALTNMDGCFVHMSAARSITDHFLGVEGGDWFHRYYEFASKSEEGLAELLHQFTGERREGTCPGHPLEEYCGEYTRRGYGPCTVSLRDETLWLEILEGEIPLEHFHYETFLTRGILGELPPGLPVHFHTAEVGGTVDGIRIPLVPEFGGKGILFTRVTKQTGE